MGFFRLPRFARRYIRRNMHPMAEKTAWSMKTKLSVVYALLAWNGFGIVLYQMYTGNKHWPVTHGIRTPEEDLARPAYQWAHALGMEKQNVKVIRINKFSGMSDVEDLVLVKDKTPENISPASEKLVQ